MKTVKRKVKGKERKRKGNLEVLHKAILAVMCL